MKTNIGKRLLSGLLSLIMVFSLVPAMDLTMEAKAAGVTEDYNQDTQTGNFISMPITIRDFASDGMLFEWNEVGKELNKTETYNGISVIHGETKGFGLLQTDTKDRFNDLVIAGTEVFSNGNWGDKVVTETKQSTLNSGAKQTVYGALIRTNLVTGELSADKKPVYTENTVTYLANYLKQTLEAAEKNSAGQYQMWYVKGEPLSELGNVDLATKLRNQITDGLGTYAAAKAKNPTSYTQVSTYHDAAYFLLHNTYKDSIGYGKTINQFKTLDMVEKVKADGSVYYTFSSIYNDAVYDTDSGRIYNSQTRYVDARKKSDGSAQYVRGNIQPENVFNPIGDLGYGKTGNTYAELIGSDVSTYYNQYNFNLSLEGHAQFIYYEDDDLYFNFIGDDDVYLYINGIRVLDVGGAHSIAKCGISLNSVADLCGLQDGQAYDFDFFYMERHGTASNFGIETNIKIVDPAMITTKTGYQNGSSTGYNGYVDPNKPVAYSFELQNNGEADIQNLTFDDKDIGVYFGHDNVVLNDDSDFQEMYLYRYNADGTVKSSYTAGSLTAEILKQELTAGLPVNEKIGIYGFKYSIPTNAWVNNTFPNTVYTTATSTGDNNSTHTLNGMADWKVQKSKLVTEPFHVYDWVAKDVSKDPTDVCDWYSPEKVASVTVTREELIKPVQDKGITVTGNATIALCTPSGSESGNNINPNATLSSDGSITYKSTKPGLDTVYYKIKGMNYDTMVFRYDVYTYGTVNNVYVLDYGLAVELNGEDFGLMVNDYLTLQQNTYGTTATVTGMQDDTSNYGDFTWENPSLKYTPDAIINDIDSVRANVQILENGATEVTKFTGVNMYEKITTAPASVVYYEENFPGITYINTDENNWAHYETVDEGGNSVAGTEQSADQDSNYGSDPNYAEDKVGEIVSGDSVGTVVDKTSFKLDTTNLDTLQSSGINALNQYLGLGGSDSNGTVNELVVNKTAEVMYFEFVGTGFEIVSRTTDEQYAVINVQVQKKNADGTYTIVKQKPVITESKGGDLYQVPIISITDLEKAEYRVVVKAAGSTDTKTRVLYIDGIRIYGPLNDGSALEYYNPEEYQAEIFEIKQLIENGQMIYADASDSNDDLQLVTGTTMIENSDPDGEFVLREAETVEEYMQIGPNNELYLDGNAAACMIAFFVYPDEGTPAAARTLEIGAHRKSDSMSEDNSNVYMTYAGTAEEIIDGTNTYEIGSGTEMYYSIDVSNLVLDKDGKYLVMIGTNGSEWGAASLALTNLKVSGYTVDFAQTAVVAAYTAGELDEISIIAEPVQVYKARLAAAKPEPTEPEVTEPEVTEPEVTEPEATEPEVTEPEVTEPEATEPEATEPEVTEPEVTLTINSAALKVAKVVSGKVATLAVKTSAEAASIAVFDAEGNEMTPTRVTSKASGDTVTFTFIWKVTGSRGDALDFTIRAYDADGRPSLNEETVTVTIK